jgi:hypothetical protein
MLFIPSDPGHYVTATSYVNVSGATEIISTSKSHENWDAKSDVEKRVILNQASIAVDGLCSYKGLKTDADQWLKFPRDGSDTVPMGVLLATCEMALKLSNNSSRGVTATGEVKSEKIGKLEISYFPSTADDKTEDDINPLIYLRSLQKRRIRINS